MKFFETLLISGSLVTVGLAYERACNAPSIVTITVPLSAVTEQHSETTLTATAPSPSYITPSDVVTVIHSSPTPTKPGGLYYFAVDDGVTHWLDEKAPPTGARLVTSSTVVIVSPMPTSQLPSSASGPIPTFWTLTLTNFYTEVDAVTVSSNPTDSIKASTKTYSRLGLGGWNSSTTTSQQNLQSADLGSSVAYGTTKTVFANSTQSVRTNENSSASRLQRRQVGALVIATIEGQVVSWTNEYQGEHEATLVSSAIVTSKTFQSALTVPGTAPISSVPQNTGELSQAASSVLQTPIISSSVMGSIIQTDVFASTTETLVPVYSNPTPSLAQTTQASLNASTTHPGFPTTTSSCPGIDRFTVDFDDLPHFATFTNNTDIPPIFNPYRKLYFSGGYGYVPPPSDPYPPISPPQLAVFNFYGNVSSNSPNAGLELDGEIGAGPRASESAYWIDAYSAWLGCANAGPLDCQIAILGYDAFNTRITSQTVRQPPCPGLQKCTLTQINFTDQFRELAGIQFEAFVDKKPVSFYMDDLSLGWSNNSCAAQTERSSAQ